MIYCIDKNYILLEGKPGGEKKLLKATSKV